MNEYTINGLSEFQARVDQLNSGSKQFLYRGQPNASWPVTCSAARRLTQDSSSPIRRQLVNSLLVGYLESLIARARVRKFFPPQLDADSSDLDFLGQLQHQGAATGLIDFTHESLVALWFACYESHETDGAVFVLNRSKTKDITSVGALEIPIAYFYRDNVLWTWDPTPLGSRIEAQGSVFVFGGTEISNSLMERFVIRSQDKQDILEQLRTQLDIYEENIYPDFPGYATANSSYKPFDLQRSISHWEQQVELAQSYDQLALAYYNCGVAYGAAYDLARAIEYFDKAIEHDPHYSTAYLNRGNAKSELDQYDGAISDFDMGLRLRPDDSSAYKSLGDSKAKLGFHREAVEDFDNSLRIQPNDASCYLSRGVAKLALGELFSAIDDQTTAIGFDPNLELAYINRSTAKAALGIYLGAISDCNVAIRINPNSVKAHINRGNSKHLLGEHKGAILDYDDAIRIQPTFPLAYYCRGEACLALELYEEAVVDFSGAIRRDPNFAFAYRQRGIARALLNRFKESKADLDRFNALTQKGVTRQMNENYEFALYPGYLRKSMSGDSVDGAGRIGE